MTTTNRSVIAGFVLGSLVTLAVSTALRRQNRRRSYKKKNTSSSFSSPNNSLPAELRQEQLSRHTLYFGPGGMAKLGASRVVVVGVGGVGSHAAHMLARAGVGHLRLIDFDQVTLSSLNRHACATLADVGTPKATCLKQYLQRICPDPSYLLVEDVVQMYTAQDGPQLLQSDDDNDDDDRDEWDLVVDAIDDVPTKAALLAHCLEHGIRVVSCMGAAGKSDVTRLHISDLRTASRDPLASKLRQSLKKHLSSSESLKDDSYMDNMEQLAVVYSSEKTVMKLADFTEEQKAEGVHHYGAVDGMRIRVLPVLGTMPAIMGQACAALALCELAEKPFMPVTGERVGRGVRHKLYQKLRTREQRLAKEIQAGAGDTSDVGNGRIVNGTWIGPTQIDSDDVEFLLEVWRNRCAVTGDRLGTVLDLVRWDLAKPSTCDNLILIGARALGRFEIEGKACIPVAVQASIERRLQYCKIDA